MLGTEEANNQPETSFLLVLQKDNNIMFPIQHPTHGFAFKDISLFVWKLYTQMLTNWKSIECNFKQNTDSFSSRKDGTFYSNISLAFRTLSLSLYILLPCVGVCVFQFSKMTHFL